MSPKEAKKHNTVYSKAFFGDLPTTIWDGTYLYTYKSSNYSSGRKGFSSHKHRPLVKFMSIVLPDGYVLETIGPFYSNGHNNDAGMTSQILENEVNGVKDWLLDSEQQNVVVDRGFRNVLDDLGVFGNLNVHMPSCDAKGTEQSSIQEANRSRLVTKIRWVVEAYHGRFKKFKLFENRQPTSRIGILKECLRILTATLNLFRPPIYNTTKDVDLHTAIANRMLERSRISVNIVETRVFSGPLSNRGRLWQEYVDNTQNEVNMSHPDVVSNFPRLSLDFLQQNLTCGSYQIQQAAHYTDEHMTANGGFTFSLHHTAPDLIRVRLQSRHKNATKYFVWVQFSCDQISGWYCKCKCGRRVVGCCAHVATVVWYLGFARHNDYRPPSTITSYWKKVIDSAEGYEDSYDETNKGTD